MPRIPMKEFSLKKKIHEGLRIPSGLRSQEQMYDAFPDLEDAVSRSQEIADTVEIDLELGKRHFPTYSIPDDTTAEDYLRELCIKGLKDRYHGNSEMVPAFIKLGDQTTIGVLIPPSYISRL